MSIFSNLKTRIILLNNQGRSCSTEKTILPTNMVTMKEMREALMAMMSAQKSWVESTSKDQIIEGLPNQQKDLPAKRMADSRLQGFLPLGDDKKERLRYLTPFGQVRFGKLLEDLDTFAVATCYKHNEIPSLKESEFRVPRAIWTVLVDRIDLTPAFKNVSDNRNITFDGHVTWVGKSSMEASIDVSQPDSNGNSVKLLNAVFVMVARDPLLNKSALVSPLIAEREEEKKIISHSESMQNLRQLMSDTSLLKTLPNEDELKMIHEIFLLTQDPTATTFKLRIKPEGTTWMEDSMLKTCQICFPEQKNLYDKIFGGFIMRQAFELAWANASIFSKKRCIAVAVDDILFRAPVNIGSFLFLSSQVGYTEDNKMQIRVNAEVRNPETSEKKTTNEFHFTLQTVDSTQVPQVLPKTYAESMIYLDSRRRLCEALLVRQ